MDDNTVESQLLQLINKKQFLLEQQRDVLFDVLSRPEHQRHLNCCGDFRARVYTPLKTLHTYIHQVLSSDKSCRNAVSGVNVVRFLSEQSRVSSNTGSYVKAKKRLWEESIYGLVKSMGDSLSRKVPPRGTAYGRQVKVFDGTTLRLRDTKANNEHYPKHSNKKLEVGSPAVRLLTVFSLMTGSVVDYALEATKGKGTGEISLLRSRLDCFEEGDIALGDALFCNFFLVHDLMKKKVDVLVPGHAQRLYAFNEGTVLGEKDHITQWTKPRRPQWMSKEAYSQYSKTISIREFQINGIVYMTTLTNASMYPKEELRLLYKRRWEAELHLRSMKTHMGMDKLTSETPDMARKEIGVHLLAYNFIRELMSDGCIQEDTLPTQISFKGTVQLFMQFNPYFISIEKDKKEDLYSFMRLLMASNKVGLRPGRVEPRAIRQKYNSFPPLKNSRKLEIEKLLTKRKEWVVNNDAA